MNTHDRIAEQAWGVLVAADPPEGTAVNIIAHAIANNVQTVLSELIRDEKIDCPEHPRPLPRPSCWQCARNGAFERAARIVGDHA